MAEPTSSSCSGGASSSGGSAEFQLNLVLQLQQSMLNFQSQLTELSLKLIQLETQQQKMNIKLEDTADSVQCQVSSSSSSVSRSVIKDISALTNRLENLEKKVITTVNSDISLLAERVLTLEEKAQVKEPLPRLSLQRQVNQPQLQVHAVPDVGPTAAGSSRYNSFTPTPTVFVSVSGGDDTWNYGNQQQQVIKVLDESQTFGSTPNYTWDGMEEEMAIPTSIDDTLGLGLTDEPEMIISEFDHNSVDMLGNDTDEMYGSPHHQSLISSISLNAAGSQPGPSSSASDPVLSKPFQGNKWFIDKLGRRHDFMVSHPGRRFICPDCPSTFSTKPYLTRHFNEKHCDPSKHKCAFCGLIIDVGHRREKLLQHVRGHEEENAANDRRETTLSGTTSSSVAGDEQQPPKRFSCKVCPNTFAKAENLACHYTISHYQAALDHNLVVE